MFASTLWSPKLFLMQCRVFQSMRRLLKVDGVIRYRFNPLMRPNFKKRHGAALMRDLRANLFYRKKLGLVCGLEMKEKK